MTRILSNDDIRSLMDMGDVVETLETAYRALADGHGTQRPRTDSYAPTAREGALYKLSTTDAIAPASGVSAIRASSGFYAWSGAAGAQRREKNVRVDDSATTRTTGLVILFSTTTGEPLAILPDDVISVLRLGATNAIGARLLAREDARTVAMLGCGRQAGGLLRGLCAVRPIEQVRCYSPTVERREAFAARWSAELGIDVRPVATPEEAVRGADIVQCATNSIQPVLHASAVERGMHLSSIRLPEIDPAALPLVDRLILFVREAVPVQLVTAGIELPERKASATSAIESAVATAPDLMDLLGGRVDGRASADDVTFFMNTVGSAFQFAVVGEVVHRRAIEAGVGRDIPTDWLTQEPE